MTEVTFIWVKTLRSSNRIKLTQLLVTCILGPFLREVIKDIVSVTDYLDALAIQVDFNLITNE